jgi:NAD(P)H dehydrogenase (quinone)
MNILLLNGNTETESFSKSICAAYVEEAQQARHTVELLNIGNIQFDPVLHEGYHTIQPLEPDLLDFQQKVLWAKHIVIVYPTWWGGPPALLKGLFDRAFYSGFAYKYHDKDPMWDKLLKGRSAHLITTMDAPKIWYQMMYHSAGTNMMKNAILKFCGIRPVKVTYISRVRYKKHEELERELAKIKKMARGVK